MIHEILAGKSPPAWMFWKRKPDFPYVREEDVDEITERLQDLPGVEEVKVMIGFELGLEFPIGWGLRGNYNLSDAQRIISKRGYQAIPNPPVSLSNLVDSFQPIKP